jgi:Ner family transcriptional regulator
VTACRFEQEGTRASQIRRFIRRRGLSTVALSRSFGYSSDRVAVALKQHQPKVERLIAEFLGVTPEKLWPQRYRSRPVSVDGWNSVPLVTLVVPTPYRKAHTYANYGDWL